MLRPVLVCVLGFVLLVSASAGGAGPAPNVEVLWGGSYWDGRVIAKRGNLVRVHYVGYGPEWDEWVEPNRVRRASPQVAVSQGGQRLEAEWQGSWWPVEVIATRCDFAKVHYVGWGPEWDEWVEPDRLRRSN